MGWCPPTSGADRHDEWRRAVAVAFSETILPIKERFLGLSYLHGTAVAIPEKLLQ